MEIRTATKQDIFATKQDLKELEYRLKYELKIRMGSIVAAAVAISAAMKLFS